MKAQIIQEQSERAAMGDYKPTADLLMKADRVSRFWRQFAADLRNEAKMRSSAEKSLINIFRYRKLRVYTSWRKRW